MRNTTRILTAMLSMGMAETLLAQSAKLAEATPEKPTTVVKTVIDKYVGPLMTVVRVDRAGDRYTFDVYLSRTAQVRGYQVTLEVTGGDTGRLELEDVRVDQNRKDYVFQSLLSFTAMDVKGARVAGALMSASVDVDEPVYLGTFKFHASKDAQGVFEVRVSGWKSEEEKSLLRNSAGEAIEFRAAPAAKITIDRSSAAAAEPTSNAPANGRR